MRVLLVNQFFWPDSSATSQLLTDLARGLADRGHAVHVICANGSYAASTPITDKDTPPPVTIHRVRALPFVRGRLGRVLSYLSFYVAATVRGLTLPRQDLVLTLTTPPLLSLLGSAIKLLRGSRHIIWEMDVYPDVAVDLGYIRSGSLADHAVGFLADHSRRYADSIVALGECMKDRLVSRGIPAAKIAVAHNWADGAAITPLDRPADGKLTLLYSGNLGLAHDVDTILDTIAALKHDDRFRFLFVGGGGRRHELEHFRETHGLASVSLLPYVQRGSLSESLAAGDIGLVTQRDACVGSVVPSKVYGLLAAGRPILFIGPVTATPARLIARFGCGWQVDCGDSDALTALLRHLADRPHEITAAGQRARAALLTHFDQPVGVDRLVNLLGASFSEAATHPSDSPDHDQASPRDHTQLAAH